MNRTIEQWQAIGVLGCGQFYNSKHTVGKLLTDAVRDLQELARQRDELAEALELCMAAVKLAGWEGDFCMDKARAALQSIKEQTK